MTRVYRSQDDRVVAGVCGGLGEAYDVDPNLLRAVAVIPTFWVLYLALWVFLPEEPEQSK